MDKTMELLRKIRRARQELDDRVSNLTDLQNAYDESVRLDQLIEEYMDLQEQV